MAIERVAIFALSIAFTTSLILYPDLPADIPPRAGRDGAFIGAPFVAFLLPTAAIAVWWIGAALNHPHRRVTSSAMRAGSLAVCFLCAFHVTMLVAFVGEQPWLTRVLGAIVGLFLIVTGNDVPRTRPALTWGASPDERKRVGPASAWRWRRLGYVRVGFGLVLLGAAVLGLAGFWRLSVLAAAAEGLLRIMAWLIAQRVRHAIATAIALAIVGPGDAIAQDIPQERLDTLPALVDATVPKLMEAGHVPGTAVAVVYRGRVLVLRGYGVSQLEPERPVDPDRTTFRIGSVSKTMTALASLQLVDPGLLDLQGDVREILRGVPLRYRTTVHQLLTHTAGIDERFAGAYTDAAEQLEPLSEHLRRRPPAQFVAPGSLYSYSNYHYAVAGAVIEQLAGMRYEQYMAAHVFEPVGMHRTTAYQTPVGVEGAELARGYQWRGGAQEPLPRRFTFASPSGGITTTASDMARLMLALLDEGVVDGRRVLSAAAVKKMLEPQYTADPHLPETTYGMTFWSTHGQQLLHKDGTLGDQIGVLVLAPASRLGIFAASNALPGVANQILEPLLRTCSVQRPRRHRPRQCRRGQETRRDWRASIRTFITPGTTCRGSRRSFFSRTSARSRTAPSDGVIADMSKSNRWCSRARTAETRSSFDRTLREG